MGWHLSPEYGARTLSATHGRKVSPLGYPFGRVTSHVCGEESHAPDPRNPALPGRADAVSTKGANGVSAGTRTDRGAEGSSGNRQETPNPALHRIAVQWRILLNVRGHVWAARGERGVRLRVS